MKYEKEQIQKIFEEISMFSVNLEEDPTLPHLGASYINKLLSQCRNFLNRVSYYLQQLMVQEIELGNELKMAELDLELKMKEKLADDEIVRKQSSISDREAMASMMLRQECETVNQLKVDILNIQESIKIVKFKHGELNRTSQDIKTQRQIIKDDSELRRNLGGGELNPNQPNSDKSIPGGLTPHVKKERVDPKDLLDPARRPENLPVPRNEAHAKQIASFLNEPMIEERSDNRITYDDILV